MEASRFFTQNETPPETGVTDADIENFFDDNKSRIGEKTRGHVEQVVAPAVYRIFDVINANVNYLPYIIERFPIGCEINVKRTGGQMTRAIVTEVKKQGVNVLLTVTFPTAEGRGGKLIPASAALKANKSHEDIWRMNLINVNNAADLDSWAANKKRHTSNLDDWAVKKSRIDVGSEEDIPELPAEYIEEYKEAA